KHLIFDYHMSVISYQTVSLHKILDMTILQGFQATYVMASVPIRCISGKSTTLPLVCFWANCNTNLSTGQIRICSTAAIAATVNCDPHATRHRSFAYAPFIYSPTNRVQCKHYHSLHRHLSPHRPVLNSSASFTKLNSFSPHLCYF